MLKDILSAFKNISNEIALYQTNIYSLLYFSPLSSKRHSKKKTSITNRNPSPSKPSPVEKTEPKILVRTKGTKQTLEAKGIEKTREPNGDNKGVDVDEQPLDPEEEKKKQKKPKKKRFDRMKEKLEAQRVEEKRILEEKLAEEEKRYNEQKRIEEEKEKLKQERLSEVLQLDLGDYHEDLDDFDDDVFDDVFSENDISLSSIEEGDFDDLERESMGAIAKETRGRLTSLSN